MRAGLLQRKCDCGNHTMVGECDDCAKKKSLLQRKASHGIESSEAPSIVNEVLRSTGQPLDLATRGFMEPRFGHDFSRVRVHTDAQAAQSARAVIARAYSAAHDIVFAAGEYQPNSLEGRKLIAHELTHVMQQQTAAGREKLTVGSTHDSYEQEADRLAELTSRSHDSQQAPRPSAIDTFKIQRAAVPAPSQPRPRPRAQPPQSEAEEPQESQTGVDEEEPQDAPGLVSKKGTEKTPCATIGEKERGKGSNKDISPWEEGWDWLTGQHEPTRYFGSGDQMTEQLRTHEAVIEARTNATRAIKDSCARDSHSTEVGDEHGINYELKGIEGIAKYVRDYSTLATFGLTGNLTATFLGSYHGCWNAQMECCQGKAALHFHITNRSGLTSATHLPVLGYDRPRPTVSDWLTNPIQTGQQWGATMPGSIVSNVEGGGPMSTVEQIFDWEEPVFFSPPKACPGSTVKSKQKRISRRIQD